MNYSDRRFGGGARPRAESNPETGYSFVRDWPGYLDGGYFDESGCLRIEYVSREKVEPMVQAMCGARPGLTTHQVRRYFNHCRAIETRLRGGGATWACVWPDVKKLDVAAADGAAKSTQKIPDLFREFINRNVDKIKTQKDFLRGFLPHFEALIGFGQKDFRKDRG